MENKKMVAEIFLIELKRTKRLSAWSFVGIVSPVIGIILSSISLSIIRSLPEPNSEGFIERFTRVRDLAVSGMVLSIIFLVIWTMVSIWGGVQLEKQINTEVNKIENKAYNIGYETAKDSEHKNGYITGCIDAINTVLSQYDIPFYTSTSQACTEEYQIRGY